MNKKTGISFAVLCLLVSMTQAQKKYEKIFYVENKVETDEMTIVGKSAVSTEAFTKFNLVINNKNNEDIILYKPEESKIIANNKEYVPNEKPLKVGPADREHKVVDIKGADFLITGYSYEISGLYKVSTTTTSIETPDFQLPPSQNEFKTGNFTCTMTELSKQTDKTVVKFNCRYAGNKTGVIHPGRAAVRLPDGDEIATAKSNKTPVLLQKGESEKITLVWDRMQGGKATDMQKIKMMLVWRNTFVESDAVKLDPVKLDFKIDEKKSK